MTGPIGAVLIGVLAGVYHPVPHSGPVVTVAHIGGALWMSMGYRWLLKKRPGTRGMLLGWVGMVLVYYFGVLVLLLTALTFLTPALDGVIFMDNPTLWHALGDLARGAVPEALATTLLTAIMLALLPARMKQFQRDTGG